MKLFELRRRLPKQADQATLTFDRKFETPRRENGNIFLPGDPDIDWFPLKKGAADSAGDRDQGQVHFS